MRKTFFIDVDGTLLEHIEDFENIYNYDSLRVLPGAKEKTAEWHCNGDLIILTTARPESMRELTVKQLRNAGVFFDYIMMGIGAGERVLINDYPEGKMPKAIAYNVIRNKQGIKDIP